MGPDMSHVLEIDAATGEVIERDFTPEELAQREADAAAHAAAEAAAEAAAAERAAARAALLERLGISEDEAVLLREAGI
jgi:hypothetical protein